MKPNVIAIDGPAASGKTTIGRKLAQHLNYLFLDTGIMYRAATLAALEKELDCADELAVVALAQALNIDILPPNDEDDGRSYTVLIEQKDVTWSLRSNAVAQHVSQVASYKGVRDEMVHRQRKIGEQGKVVMVGRDIGTVVLPAAPLKLYVVASAAERARRRWEEQQQRGDTITYEAMLADIQRRDQLDRSRKHSPLRAAPDAHLIDSTEKTPDQLLADLLTLIETP